MPKLTVVKVVSTDYKINSEDIERWREIFDKKLLTPEAAVSTGEVEIQHIDHSDPENSIVLVKIGSEDYKPTFADLESWRNVFKESQNDPDFKIFTHNAINISIIPIGKIVEVEGASKEDLINAINDGIISQLE